MADPKNEQGDIEDLTDIPKPGDKDYGAFLEVYQMMPWMWQKHGHPDDPVPTPIPTVETELGKRREEARKDALKQQLLEIPPVPTPNPQPTE